MIRGRKRYFCPNCRVNPKFSFLLELPVAEIESIFHHPSISFCYTCGNKICREDNIAVCKDGCKLVNFTLNSESIPANNTKSGESIYIHKHKLSDTFFTFCRMSD